ncbi:hypothetical protein [Fusobacterium ulcerans]|uniref:hypothetical protein n=1 Tax=Fusobacterium ulcerans TaxID=861 RepID=UPI0030B6EAA5
MATKNESNPTTLNEILDNWQAVTLNNIHTTIPGTILSFDPVKMEASVLPLARPVIAGESSTTTYR